MAKGLIWSWLDYYDQYCGDGNNYSLREYFHHVVDSVVEHMATHGRWPEGLFVEGGDLHCYLTPATHAWVCDLPR